jgi:hypothetical protein
MFVILNECEESRIVCGTVPARDPSAATLCQDDTIAKKWTTTILLPKEEREDDCLPFLVVYACLHLISLLLDEEPNETE